MAITQNDLEILKSEIMADTPDGGGLPTGIAVIDNVSNDLFPDVSDIDRLLGRVRLRKVSLGVKTANADLLQAVRLLFTELPDNPNISVFAFKASSFADRRADAQNKIESYLAFGTKWAGHLLETQLAGQRVIQVSLDKNDQVPAVGQPLVIVQNEGQSDEFYQYIKPLKVDTIERRFQRTVSETVTRIVATIEFGDPLSKSYNGLAVNEFYQNINTSRRAILREARVADAAKYYSASRLAEPVVAMTSRQVKIDSIYTQIVPSTQVETPLLQRDPANQVATQARGEGFVEYVTSATTTASTTLNLPSGVAVGTLTIAPNLGTALTDREGELFSASGGEPYASINYSTGQIIWYKELFSGQITLKSTYKPASEFTRVAQTDYQVVGANAGYNYVRELGAEPVPNSLKITYAVDGNNYLIHDDGRGNLVDDNGNGRGTVQGKTVLLTTSAIPDVGSYIIYTFGVDLDTVKYAEQALLPAYHAAIIADDVSGDVVITWGVDKTATATNGVITGDATGTFTANELRIAPNDTVAKGTAFTVTYSKALDSMTTPIVAEYTPQAADGIFTGSVSVSSAIERVNIYVVMSDTQLPQIMVNLVSNTSGTGLEIKGVYAPAYNSVPIYSGNTVTTKTSMLWLPMGSSVDDWQPTLLSSSVDKSTGTANFSIKVARKKTVVDVLTIGSSGTQKQVFNTKKVDELLFISAASVSGVAILGVGTESASISVAANSMVIAPPQVSDTPIVNGSVFIDALGYSLRDDAGVVKNGEIVVGSIDINSGVIELSKWDAGKPNAVTLKSMLRENDPVPLANIIFRTPVAPLKEASLQISATLADGTVLSLGTGAQGAISGSPYAHGTVDFKAGVVALYFYEKLKVADNPTVVNQPWYSASNVYLEGGANYINKPMYVKPDSIRYNAIAYSYLPLDKELIGLDPVRLPTDGRVPFVRKGDSIAITELKTMQLPTNAPNDLFNLGFERLSDVNVVDSTGKKVSFDYLDIDLDAGTLQLNGLFDMSFYTAPLTAKYRIMDIALVIETDISGRVTLSTPITHDYSTAAVFSSMLLAGDMQARAYNVFGQKSWSSVFSDTLIGDATTSQLQITNNPIVVTNRDSIEERWALVFTSPTAFNIIGQTVGQIGTGMTSTLTAPINPMTGYAYFTIPAAAWGTGWSANNVVRINTAAAKYPVWIGNAIQQHQGSSTDNYDFTIGYHANIDRERAV